MVEKELEKNVNQAKAKSIETSLEIIDSLNNGESSIEEESRRIVESFFSRELLANLPEDVDALCLNNYNKIYREKYKEEVNEKPLIWGRREVKKYVNKLKKNRV